MVVSTSIIIIFAISGLISLLAYHLNRRHLYRVTKSIPGPVPLPMIGNAHDFFGDTAQLIDRVMTYLDTHSSPCRLWLGPRLVVMFADPEQIKTILLSPKALDKDELYLLLRPWIGTGLFSAPAAKWKVHRRMIMPTFNQKILESFVEVFAQKSQILVQQMEVELGGKGLDVFDYVSLCTFDIICETAMGISSNVQITKDLTYLNASKRVLEIMYMRIFKAWLHPNFIFNLTSLGKDQKECLKILHGQTDRVIKQKRQQEMLEKNSNSEETSKDAPGQRKTFLTLLMELSNDGKKLTDQELREEVDTMLIAGNDTTATVNTFTIYMLANFPEIQQRCYEELRDNIGDKIYTDEPITYEDLHQMEYLERVIKETMRLFPVGPLIVRQVTEDLNIGEHILPRGASAVIAILKLHRSANVWPNPLVFDPDRFLPEELAKRHPYAFIPFSAGPRNCVGIKYAMMSMKALLSTVLRRYLLKVDTQVRIEDIQLKADIVLKPVIPIVVKIEKRPSRIN